MNTVSIWVELEGTEVEIQFNYTYSYQAAKLSGPWDESYPESEDFEFEVIEPTFWLNALEQWELNDIPEEVFFEAAMEDIASDKADYADYKYDEYRDSLMEGC